MEQKILELLSDGKAHELFEIVDYLELNQASDEIVINILTRMVDNYDVYCTKKGKYMLFSESEMAKTYVKGIFLETNQDYGFVRVLGFDDDIFIHGSKANGAMDGDVVLVHITKQEKGDKKCEGEVAKVLRREVKNKVGTVCFSDDYNDILVKLDDKKFPEPLILDGDRTDLVRLVEGDKIVVNFSNRKKKNKIIAIFKRHIGHINDPGIDIEAILAERDVYTEFPQEVLDELKNIPTEVREVDLIGRRDLRDEIIFTIDGDDTKDIDDAISVRRLDNGNWHLGVHIADVSYYVKEGSAIDLEARKRGTSVYVADRVVAMLPHQLSNGICSLNPDVLRLAVSCEMEIDNKGNLVSYEIFPSVIRSRIQMTYKKVNAFLEEGIIAEGYEPYIEMLSNMRQLSSIIRNNKVRRGCIDFDTDEAKIIVDEEGKAIDIVKRERGVGEKLIEDFMIIANETVANHFYYMDLPALYRIHGLPDEERLIKFLNVLSNFGISLNADIKKMKPRVVQAIVNELKKYPQFRVLSTRLLSCMDKAIYSPENVGHFGIASTCYTHFTSPIRRYPDTTIHRLLRNYFFMEDGITDEKIRHFKEILSDIAIHSSERERASVECEREVDAMKMAEYMEDHIGEEFTGMISGVTSFGLFVQLDNLIEGLVHVSTFEDEEYEYDSKREILVGRSTRNIFRLGDEVVIKVVSASKEARTIDFSIVKRVSEDEKEYVKKKY